MNIKRSLFLSCLLFCMPTFALTIEEVNIAHGALISVMAAKIRILLAI